ncbi:MAG: hypothetical protein GKS06_04620 [Acidobacteria bacterium]|nr:hypothetical protein [Acidobacteriota bacterium]
MNIYQDVLFRGLDVLRGRHNVERTRFLRKSQYWSADQLAAWQLERLNALLAQARDNSPFFAQRLASVRLPMTDVAGLADLPVLTKADIRAHRERIRTTNLAAHRYVLNRTGGSTGEPIHYYWDKNGQDWNRGSVYRSGEWAGLALGDRAINMSGAVIDASESERWSHRAANWILRHRDCPVAAVTNSDLVDYHRTLMRFRPASIWGYASAIDAFAAHIERTGSAGGYHFLRALVTSSETLRPEQRERIERVFGTGKVFDHYGSREVYLAAECAAHDGYHVHAEVLIVEVVGPDDRPCAPGQLGRVLVTDLSNHAFPFIRYEIGDLAVAAPPTPCACGVTLPRLTRVEGRVGDLVVLPDRILTVPNFCTLFSTFADGIDAFQVQQDSLDGFRVLLKTGTGYTEAIEQRLREALAELGGNAQVEISTDQPIPVSESGKRRFVISGVDLDRVA